MVAGEVQEVRRSTEAEFNRIIEIERRERQRVEILLSQIDPRQKTLVFCATQAHALTIHSRFSSKQQLFHNFVLQHYVSSGVQELAQEKLAPLLRLRYCNSIGDAVANLGEPEETGRVFASFQRSLNERSDIQRPLG